jgi:hypothetical protein
MSTRGVECTVSILHSSLQLIAGILSIDVDAIMYKIFKYMCVCVGVHVSVREREERDVSGRIKGIL